MKAEEKAEELLEDILVEEQATYILLSLEDINDKDMYHEENIKAAIFYQKGIIKVLKDFGITSEFEIEVLNFLLKL